MPRQPEHETVYVDDEGVRRLNPRATCPAFAMPCSLAWVQGICPGFLYDHRQPCPTFVCETCGEEVPFSFGADDNRPHDCDDCWDEATNLFHAGGGGAT
jgi:hypothetical protein